MSFDNPFAIALIIANDMLLYVTLPLHARLLYVLLKPSSKKDLDSSFHTIMINTTIVNLIFALDSCIILEPSAAGIFFEFYEMMGPFFAKIELIKTTMFSFTNDILHLVLSINRFTAIAFPLKRKSIGVNLYGAKSVEFTFLGNYYMIYSMATVFPGMSMQFGCLLFYIGMLFKFNDFRKMSTSDVKRMTRGVLRTTIAACCISMGIWILVIFSLSVYASYWTRGVPLIEGNYFSAALRFITAVNNVLTPWVMLIAFSNIRLLVFGSSKACQARKSTNATISSVAQF